MLSTVTAWLVDPAGLTPHGFCLLWEPGLIWTYALSDGSIALAYFSIPAALALLARRRRDLVFRPVFWLFAAFILLCGATHVLDVLTLWVPAYGLEAVVKAATAATSLLTAALLWRLLPEALTLPSQAQLRNANIALQDSERRERESFELSPAPLVRVDTAGTIGSVSNSWLAMLGYEREEVIGRTLREFAAPGTPTWVEADLRKLEQQGEIHELDRRYVRRNGTVIDTLVSARVEQTSGSWSICHFQDITPRRKAEAALRATAEQLRQAQKMEAIGQLTGGVAHDFNNMLQSIGGSLELIEQNLAQGRTDRIGRYMGMTRKAVDRASGLTNQLLAFARRQALQPRSIEPDELVTGMADLLRGTLGPTIQARLDLHDGVWQARCDVNQLESALLNLAINARDAMPDGGVLTLSTADRTLGPKDIAGDDGAEPGDYVEIAVTDTGTGMTDAVLAQAFEPFFTTKPLGHGTGLGLSQVYGFVRQSGGFVRIETAPGQGTTVRLFLPRFLDAGGEAASDATQAPPALPARPGRHDVTVLVVEDQDDIRGMMAEALREKSYTVLEAPDGPAGLQLLQSPSKIDLLVSDVGLPGLNGRQLAQTARQIRPHMPVLLITGYAGSALEASELGDGIELLRKPFAIAELAARAVVLLEETGWDATSY